MFLLKQKISFNLKIALELTLYYLIYAVVRSIVSNVYEGKAFYMWLLYRRKLLILQASKYRTARNVTFHNISVSEPKRCFLY